MDNEQALVRTIRRAEEQIECVEKEARRWEENFNSVQAALWAERDRRVRLSTAAIAALRAMSGIEVIDKHCPELEALDEALKRNARETANDK